MLAKENTKQKSFGGGGTALEFKHRHLEDNEKKSMLIVAKVENIFLNIKTETTYYSRIRWIIFSIVFCTTFSTWINTLTFGASKNNTYCFDTFTHTFKICKVSKFLDVQDGGGITNFIFMYIGDNYDAIKEVDLINEKYRKFFLKDAIYYSSINYNSFNKFTKSLDFYKVVIVVTSKEGYNFNIMLMLRSFGNVYYLIALFSVLGYFTSNLLGNFLSDVSFF
jgi:hypothetical protein